MKHPTSPGFYWLQARSHTGEVVQVNIHNEVLFTDGERCPLNQFSDSSCIWSDKLEKPVGMG
jgi:hypothetical protein